MWATAAIIPKASLYVHVVERKWQRIYKQFVVQDINKEVLNTNSDSTENKIALCLDIL